MRFSDLKVKTKLQAAMGVLLLSLGTVIVVGLMALGATNAGMNLLFEERTKAVAWLGEIYGLQLRNIQLLDYSMARKDTAVAESAGREIARNRELITKNMKEWEARIRTDEGRGLYETISRDRDELMAATNAVREALTADNPEAAQKLRADRLEPAFEAVRQATATALAFQLERARVKRDETDALFRTNRTVVLTVGAIGIGLSLLLATLLIRSLTTSLSAALLASKRIAGGALGDRFEITSQDEVGELLGSLQQMDAKLSEIVGGVRASATEVASAAHQLSQGNDDLSDRTQSQAASLEQTAASMEQMTATVKQNADNALQANALAGEAQAQASNGSGVVTQAISAMNEINASSSKISDIIGVIDEIAFQTNLLALNAAVEAARAGEQGRGFAVVATEVRSLAQRSAGAAREIKTLIGDSVLKVKAGATLVNASGSALSDITRSVERVSIIVGDISAASKEQAQGIDQVNTAVTQMDMSTQQNAALVEQASAASKALLMQTEKLMSQVAFFSIKSNAAATSSTADVVLSAPTRVRTVQPTIRRKMEQSKPFVTPAPSVLRKVSGGDNWNEF